MRSRLEEILQLHRKLAEQMEYYEAETQADEYRMFWRELKDENHQQMQKLSRYMVIKCNR